MLYNVLTTIKNKITAEEHTILFKNVKSVWDSREQAKQFINNMNCKVCDFTIIKEERIEKDDWTMEEVEDEIFLLELKDRWSREDYDERDKLHHIKIRLIQQGA